MDQQNLKELLLRLKSGETEVDDVIERLKHMPFENLGFAHVDHHRAIRQGFPEVIFGHGKTADQISAIAEKLLARSYNLLVTRTDRQAFERISALVPEAV